MKRYTPETVTPMVNALIMRGVLATLDGFMSTPFAFLKQPVSSAIKKVPNHVSHPLQAADNDLLKVRESISAGLTPLFKQIIAARIDRLVVTSEQAGIPAMVAKTSLAENTKENLVIVIQEALHGHSEMLTSTFVESTVDGLFRLYSLPVPDRRTCKL